MAEIAKTGNTAESAPGKNSQYDILVDGTLVFSKQREGRWPELDEILAALP